MDNSDSTKCFLNSLKCTKIAAAGVPAPDHARGVYSDPDTHDVRGLKRKKTGTKFVSLLIELVGLPGWVPYLTGNNLANFVCNYQNYLFLNNRAVLKNSDLYSTKCFLFSLKCTKIVGDLGSAPDPAGELTALPQTP